MASHLMGCRQSLSPAQASPGADPLTDAGNEGRETPWKQNPQCHQADC